MSTFYEKYSSLRSSKQSLLCVGLDPDPERIPEGYDTGDISADLHSFLADVVDATADLAVAYKPNLAFYEALGSRGWSLLERLIGTIRDRAPGTLIIADAKRGDVGNTARFYARAFFETLACDALTVNAYPGLDTLEPYQAYRNQAIMVLGYTSNPGASLFLEQGNPPLFMQLARAIARANETSRNLWLVVGATVPGARIKEIRSVAGQVPFLVPGVGAQGGNLDTVLTNAGSEILINAGRDLLYATNSRDRVHAEVSRVARAMAGEIRKRAAIVDPRNFPLRADDPS